MAGRGGHNRRYTEAMIEAALRKNFGMVAEAARSLKCHRNVIHERIKDSPALQAVLISIDNEMRDHALATIRKSLKKGDIKTAQWYAERKMRGDGYGTHVATTTENGAAIERIAAAIAGAGLDACRAVAAALAGNQKLA